MGTGAAVAVRTAGKVGYGRNLETMVFEPKQYISNAGSDRVVAGNGPNELYGNGGNDTLVAKNGDDMLFGGAGRDTLFGGKGADYFVFNEAPLANNIDRVMDFSRGQGDKLAFSYKHFKAVNPVLKYDPFGAPAKDSRLDIPVATLSKNEFRVGPTALLETDRIVYDKPNGVLSFDVDGSGAEAAVKIAVLKAGTTVSWSDILFY